GGNDLISKPISPLELIVKATIYLLSNSRPGRERKKKPQAPNVPFGSPAATGAGASGKSEKGSGAGATGDGVSEPGGNKMQSFHATVNEKVMYLRQTLAEETQRRELVEQQAAENAKRRSKLEAAIEENQRSQEMFRQLLEEVQKAQESAENGGHINLAGRRRALIEAEDFVADKLVRLKQALVEETKRRQAVEEQAAENTKRRAE